MPFVSSLDVPLPPSLFFDHGGDIKDVGDQDHDGGLKDIGVQGEEVKIVYSRKEKQ